MNEKYSLVLSEFLTELPVEQQPLFKELAEYCVSLGYAPKRTKTKDVAVDFFKNKVKKTIMKLELHDNGVKTKGPGIRLKFYANHEYSHIFRQGVKRVIEEFDGKYSGCYGCGRCAGGREGYTYVYPDGKTVFRCGSELISVHDFGMSDIPEIKILLEKQDQYFMEINQK